MHDKSKSSEFQPVPSPVTNDFVSKEQQALSQDGKVELEPEEQLKSSKKDIETIDCSGDKNNSWKHSVLVAALDTIQNDSSDENKSQWQDLEKTLAEGDSSCVDTVLSSLNKLDETLQEISLTSKEQPEELSSQTNLAVEVTVPIIDKTNGANKEKNDTDASEMLVQNNVTLQSQTESADTNRYTLATDSDINTSAYGTANHSPSEEMLESPAASNFSDIHSEGSTDSGKSAGDALMPGLERRPEVPMQETKVYEFEFPQELCGRLIGRQGQTITFIKNTSRANIYVKRHPYNNQLKLCVVSGPPASIEKALSLIRKKFPVNKFSGVSLAPVNGQEKFPDLSGQGIPVPDTLQLHLPEGIMCDVILSSLINGGHFFLQQPTHPTYPSLCQLDQNMLTCYMQMASPELPRPVDVGVICAAPMMEGWYRALVTMVYEESDECDIKFVDYGGYSRVLISSLRQIRSDFMTLPFQASECYLGNVIPIDEEAGWTMEAYTVFEEIAQGQILQAQVVAYAEDGVPYVHLYRIQGATTTFINRELVTRGVALWIEHEG